MKLYAKLHTAGDRAPSQHILRRRRRDPRHSRRSPTISEIRDAMLGASALLLRSCLAGASSLGNAKLGESIQVDLWIPHFSRLHKFVPGNLVPLVCRGARQHARKSGFRALGRLVMEIAAADALDEGLLLLRIGKFQIGRKASGNRKGLRLRLIFRGRTGGLPRFVAPDAQWAGIR